MTFDRVRHRLRLSQTPTGRMVSQEVAMDVDVLSHALLIPMSFCRDVLDCWQVRCSYGKGDSKQAICHGGYIMEIRRLKTQMKSSRVSA